jgi:CSLREA domain-containing protein
MKSSNAVNTASPQPRLRSLYGLLALLGIGASLLAPASPARANTAFSVNTTNDTADVAPGDGFCADAASACSLRAAIEESNALPGLDQAELPDGTYYLSDQLVVEDHLRLVGSSKLSTVIHGNDATELLAIPSDPSIPGGGPTAYLYDLTLRNGRTQEDGGPTAGIMIGAGAGAVLYTVGVIHNSSSEFGGGIQNWGTLQMIDSEVSNNILPPGINGQTSQGGGIYNAGEMQILRSLIANNVATRGGGISNTNEGFAVIENTTISGNRVYGAGGGIRNNADGEMHITSSTITNNRSGEPNPEGWYIEDRQGAGIYNGDNALVGMANTILAGNDDNSWDLNPTYSPDCYSPGRNQFRSHRDNLIGILNANCLIDDTSFDQVGSNAAPLDPLLQPLDNYGGPTWSHALTENSPALDADLHTVNERYYNCPSTDQRATARPQGRRCDIGAFEYIHGVQDEVPGSFELIDQPPQDPSEAGLRATLRSTKADKSAVTIAVASVAENPSPVPLKNVGGRFLTLALRGVEADAVLDARFYYPAKVSAADERDASFQLLYFSGSEWRPVRGSRGSAPRLDTRDNADGSISGGRFILSFDASSSPSISELDQAVFAATLAKLPPAPGE